MTDSNVDIREIAINAPNAAREVALSDAPDNKQSSTATTAEQKTKKTRSRLSQAAIKIKDEVRKGFIPNLENLKDREFTQEELLSLVKVAEAEFLKEKLEELDRKGITPAGLEEIGAIDIEALAQEATELTECIQKNEEGLTEIVEREKNGKKVPKEEFLMLWQERGSLIENLYEVEWQRRSYERTFADKALAGMMQKLFAPLNKLLLRMWKELNRKNPDHPALSTLRATAYTKTRKAHEGKWGMKEEYHYRKWRKDAPPAELALQITQIQMRSSSPMETTNLALAT